MQRFPTGSVVDLVAAAGARGRNDHFFRLLANGREEYQLADLHRNIKMLFFITEGARHAAASRGNELYGVVLG